MDNRTIRDSWRLVAVPVMGLLVVVASAGPALAKKELPPVHYRVTIDPKSAEKDLLPAFPKGTALGLLLSDDLARVPEVQLHEPIAVPDPKKGLPKDYHRTTEPATVQNARLIAHINFLNKKKNDRFIELLVEHRADLAGLPFSMGDACRLKSGDRKEFKRAVELVQQMSFATPAGRDDKKDNRWKTFDTDRQCKLFDGLEDRYCAAACMQMTALDSTTFRLEFVKRLAAYDKSDLDKLAATQALTKLAVFEPDETLRRAAIAALQTRGLGADTALLLHGLRYPWPSIARTTAETVAELKRDDLVPELIKMLDEPDPRAPASRTAGDKTVSFVREVVKINHHRNCLLCHPPGNTPDVMTLQPWDEGKYKRALEKDVDAYFVNIKKQADDILVGAVPTPGEELPSASDGYGSFRSPDVLVRADITYLRQDFSLAQKVENAKPWPDMQRFDYLVRTRVVSEKEATAYRGELTKSGPSPYRTAALATLRRLTGLDAGATAAAWREALRNR